MENITVAVIGGSGFLGQHIVRELQLLENKARSSSVTKSPQTTGVRDDASKESQKLNDDNASSKQISISMSDLSSPNELLYKKSIKEIRVLDVKPFRPVIEIRDHPPVTFHECDVRLESRIFSELEGVDAVIHCAATLPSMTQQETKDDKDLLWETNLEGTENVVWACRKANIKALVYASTIIVVMGGEKIVVHSENLTPSVQESKLILGTYAKIRLRAEKAILDAHKSTNDEGGTLLTTALRPVFMYGEGDTRVIPFFIDLARKAGGKMPVLFLENLHQFSYAGNIALAHVEALFQLLQGNSHPLRDCGGVPVYINDDSPSGSLCDILKPFLSPFNLTIERNTWSYYAIFFFYMVLAVWISFWAKVGKPSKFVRSYPPMKMQNLFSTTTVVSRTRAELAFNYKPIYPTDRAVEDSLVFYKKLLGDK